MAAGISSSDDIAIGVPVRNEVSRLPGLLTALARQADAPVFTLCLLFDNCDDGSEELAASLIRSLPYAVRTDRCDRGGAPNAGIARARAMAMAEAAAPDGVLLTTDADGEPRIDWLANNLMALRTADLVAGKVVRSSGRPSSRQDRVEAYYHRLHAMRRAIDPVPWEGNPTHHWTSAASLAMHAAAYRLLGGFAPIANGEDAALCDAAARAGYRLKRDAGIVVATSARRHGRADGGFAAALAMLDDENRMPMACHPEDETWRFQAQAGARQCHGSSDYTHLSRQLGLSLREIEQVAAECRNGEAFAARIVGTPPGGMRSVSLGEAELLLSALEQSQFEGAA